MKHKYITSIETLLHDGDCNKVDCSDCPFEHNVEGKDEFCIIDHLAGDIPWDVNILNTETTPKALAMLQEACTKLKEEWE